MNMKKIMVIGSPGAGKTTFARALSRRVGIPLYHLDAIWHRPDRTHISRETFDEELAHILSTPAWIIDGNYNRTILPRLLAADTVFLFDLPVEVCLCGIEARREQARPDMPWIETEPDPEFEDFVRAFPETSLPTIREHIRLHGAGKQIMVFHTREQADAYLRDLS